VALEIDWRGHLWVATGHGYLFRWDGAAWRNWTGRAEAPGGITALETHRSEMWAANNQGGRLFRWSDEGWHSIPVAGLPPIAYDIHVGADGILWLGTSEGLVRYQPPG
jgi:ligand-binding sensor domain-containing protein